MEEQLEELKRDMARVTRILSVQTITIREMLDALQSIKETMDSIVSYLEKLEVKLNATRSTH